MDVTNATPAPVGSDSRGGPIETGLEPSGESDVRMVLKVLTDAVEVLLRRADRQFDEEIQTAFAAGHSSMVLLREIEREQAAQFRDQLRSFRFA